MGADAFHYQLLDNMSVECLHLVYIHPPPPSGQKCYCKFKGYFTRHSFVSKHLFPLSNSVKQSSKIDKKKTTTRTCYLQKLNSFFEIISGKQPVAQYVNHAGP